MLIFFPFLLQALLIGLDEYCFHLKRNLPKWERIGHPLDTLTIFFCLCWVLFVPYSPLTLKGYIALAILSCLFVTKDEFVHKHHCPATEQWLHALLFLNHPILLTCLGLMWPLLHGQETVAFFSSLNELTPTFFPFLALQAGLVFLFFLYQVIYWNFYRSPA